MSTKLNENQLIAVHLLASGYKSCEVAKKLNIRQETFGKIIIRAIDSNIEEKYRNSV